MQAMNSVGLFVEPDYKDYEERPICHFMGKEMIQ
jgi:hypothetical protein